MVATFVRLKLAILRNRVRHAMERPERVVVSAVILGFFVVMRVLTDETLVDLVIDAPDDADAGTAVAVALALVVTSMWLLFSLMGGQRASLPLGPMIVLPLSARQIVSGLFVSGLFGLGFPLTLAVFGFLAGAYYDDAAALSAGIVAAIALTVQLMVLGRMMSTVAEMVRRARHPRLATLGSAAIVVVIAGFAAVASSRALDQADGAAGWDIAGWLPPSMIARAAPEALQGDVALAFGLIVLGSLFTIVLWLAWVALIGKRVEMGAPAASGHHTRGDAFAKFGRREPAGRLGAIAARERTIMFRSPVLLASKIVYVGFFGVIFAVIIASAAPDGFAPLGALAFTFPLTVQRTNQIAARARGRWLAVVTPGPRWADVAGYDLAYAPTDVGLVVVASLVISAVTDSWEMAVPAILLGITLLLIGQAIIHVVAYRLAVPPSWDATASDDASKPSMLQGLATTITFFLAAIPVAILIIYGVADDGLISLWLVVPVSVLYGVALWALTLWWTSSWLDRDESDLQSLLRV